MESIKNIKNQEKVKSKSNKHEIFDIDIEFKQWGTLGTNWGGGHEKIYDSSKKRKNKK